MIEFKEQKAIVVANENKEEPLIISLEYKFKKPKGFLAKIFQRANGIVNPTNVRLWASTMESLKTNNELPIVCSYKNKKIYEEGRSITLLSKEVNEKTCANMSEDKVNELIESGIEYIETIEVKPQTLVDEDCVFIGTTLEFGKAAKKAFKDLEYLVMKISNGKDIDLKVDIDTQREELRDKYSVAVFTVSSYINKIGLKRVDIPLQIDTIEELSY